MSQLMAHLVRSQSIARCWSDAAAWRLESDAGRWWEVQLQAAEWTSGGSHWPRGTGSEASRMESVWRGTNKSTVGAGVGLRCLGA